MGDKAARTRARILDAAAQCLTAGGLGSARLHTAIASLAGLSRPTVYKHVGDQDAIIERVRETNHYPCALASFIYENTTEESPLRRLLVDFYAYAYERSWFVGNDRGPDMDDAPREFFRDVLVKIIMLKEGPALEEPGDWPWVKDRCQYHDHAGGIRCILPVL